MTSAPARAALARALGSAAAVDRSQGGVGAAGVELDVEFDEELDPDALDEFSKIPALES